MGQICSHFCKKFSGYNDVSPTQCISSIDEQENFSIIHETQHCDYVHISIDIDEPNQSLLKDVGNFSDGRARQTISEYVKPRPPLRSYRSRSPSTESIESIAKKIRIEEKYIDFPILKDQSTMDYIPKTKVMVIMRGLSGSGKSYIANIIKSIYKDLAVECSADLYFVQENGGYNFDPGLLKEAHKFCSDSAKAAISEGLPLIIINNTNVLLWEYKKYLYIAKENGYKVLLIEPQTPWAWNPEHLINKTTHMVSLEVLHKKLSQYQLSKPLYFGWFLNTSDSSLIVNKGWECLRSVMTVQNCRESLLQYCVNTRPSILSDEIGFSNYFSQCGSNGNFQLLHCTAMFTNRMKAEGAAEYVQREAVVKSIGKAFNLFITEFIITPRTIGARILLPDYLIPLWGAVDDLDDMSQEVSQLYEDLHKHTDNTLHDIDISSLNPRNVPDVNDKSRTLTDLTIEQIKKKSGLGDRFDRFCPINTRTGSRAHMTLGIGPKVGPVVTGFYILYTVNKEIEAKTSKFTRYDVNDGILIDYNEGMFVFYPNEPLEVTALFGAFY